MNGVYSCPAPLEPAAYCPADSWPLGPNAGCGPQPPHDCRTGVVCDHGVWACPATCTAPLSANGVANLDDLTNLPASERCGSAASGNGNLLRYDEPCAGSILVFRAFGTDCGSYWLFDARTKKLVAEAGGCDGYVACSGGAPGFVYPKQCFDGTVTRSPASTDLCTADDSANANDAAR